MARTAVSELQQQIEEVRRAAFAAGYAAAIQAIREFASRPAPKASVTASRRRSGAGRKAPATANRGRRARAAKTTARPRTSAAVRPERGANAQRIEEILKSAAPHALRQAEIRKALQEKGSELAFTSIRHALGQLQTRNAAEQVGDSKTWRYSGSTS